MKGQNLSHSVAQIAPMQMLGVPHTDNEFWPYRVHPVSFSSCYFRKDVVSANLEQM